MFEADNRVKLYLIRVLHESGRHQDSSLIIKSLIESNFIFVEEDFHLIISVWQSIINPLRIAIINVNELISNENHYSLANLELKNQLNLKLTEFIEYLKTSIIPKAESDETKAIFYKHLGDFQRYKLICINEDEKKTISFESKTSYEKSLDIIRVMAKPQIELKTTIILNLSILNANYLNLKQKSIDTINELKKETKQSFEKFSEELKPKMQNLIDLMEENLLTWNL